MSGHIIVTGAMLALVISMKTTFENKLRCTVFTLLVAFFNFDHGERLTERRMDKYESGTP
jgi:hypothetical protein